MSDTVGGVDPAVGIHHILRNLFHNTINRIPDVLSGGHQQAARHQHDEGRLKLYPVI